MGSFRAKTPIPYRYSELQTLVEQVLAQIGDEIREHFERPEVRLPFGRHGKIAVFFHGDYYYIKIDPQGRLVSFHPIELSAS